MKNAINIANNNQKEASDPLASVFVSASAGSGKTKLLVDRLLRLMLPLEMVKEDGTLALIEGADPSRILCLTYTNAAASEMAHRLQSRLAEWVALSEDDLGQELRSLDVPDMAETRSQARGLFLRVLDLPAGLRIETIHAFCQSLLRRFPLEAIIDPHFKLIEAEESTQALSRAVEKILEETASYVESLSLQISLNDMLGEVLKNLAEKLHHFSYIFEAWKSNPHILSEIYGKILNIGTSLKEEITQEIITPPKEKEIKENLKIALTKAKNEKQEERITAYLNWFYQDLEERAAKTWYGLLFTKDDKPRSFSKIILKDMDAAAPSLRGLLEEEAERQIHLRDKLKSHELRALNLGLMNFALPVLDYFKREKSLRAVVDYHDLIIYTRSLLRDPGSAWVLYKLDGGIDHLLLDEVQDTSLEQWKIAASLTEDFFSGKNDREHNPRPRTIFAVGDFKQSIFSFQGAEPEQFLKWRGIFAKRVQDAGLLWKEPELHVSFRSVPVILRFVDAVFVSEISSQGILDQQRREALEHISARKEEGGRVEIWDLIGKEEKEASQSPWNVPDKNKYAPTAEQKLVDRLVCWIKEKIGKPVQEGANPLKYGDILILFRKRSQFASLLMRSLKSHHIPVASFLGTELTENLVVKDLMALCATLLLPQDTLSLATVLTSPIGDISDDSLMDLMTNNRTEKLLGRGGSLDARYSSLWDILRARHQERAEWRKAWECLSSLYRRVDYDTPYRILVQLLGVWGGRARFLERLGVEASDPIDELLTESLNYEKEHGASLQGFLHWLERTEKRSKREAENTGDAIRMMTIHGAKGLQARLVIIPDVHAGNAKSETILWADIPQRALYESSEIPLWVPRNAFQTKIIDSYKSKLEQKRLEEENRLLYVALTRASDYLLICGIETSSKNDNEYRWYHQARKGLLKCPYKEEAAFFDKDAKSYFYQEPVLFIKENKITSSYEVEEIALPSWMGAAPQWIAKTAPREDALTRPLAPSRPDGVEFGPLPLSRSPLERFKGQKEGMVEKREFAMLRGRLVHRLLQILPDIEVKERYQRARAWLSQPGWGLTEALITRLAGQVLTVLEDERLQPLFGEESLAEQAISGTIITNEGGRVVLGKVDRFAIEGDIIWLCDYKTDRKPPKDASKISSTYLRQMAAYYGVMKNIYPHHHIKCFFVWTEGPEVTYLSEAILQEHL